MEQTQNTESVDTALTEMAAYHQQMKEKYAGVNPEDVRLSADAQALITFNGYYTLDHTPGAFFAIDTNMHIQSGASSPIYDVALIVSLDGKKSERFPFTGTFDGTHLVQTGAAGDFSVNLTLSRTDNSQGTTATCSGMITLPASTWQAVNGYTYNNPIPSSLFQGEYYETEPLYIQKDGQYQKEKVAVAVMRIDADYRISYDFGSNNGSLQPVSSYSYNMNMYYFTFTNGINSVNLIMGSAAEGGLACNNMVVNTQTNAVTARSLQTVPFPIKGTLEIPNSSSNELAAFSGYYQLPSIAPGAFISIQAQYIPILGSVDVYLVKIGISLDGISATGYYFDAGSMSFNNNTLTMPGQSVSITFNRTYDTSNGSLVTVTGNIGSHQANGFTLFNPVPLHVFGGVPMTDSKGNSLTVVNDWEVIYNGTTMKSIIYVPIMYILANPWDAPTTVMSFGTSGLKGNTCIVLQGGTTEVVSAIQ